MRGGRLLATEPPHTEAERAAEQRQAEEAEPEDVRQLLAGEVELERFERLRADADAALLLEEPQDRAEEEVPVPPVARLPVDEKPRVAEDEEPGARAALRGGRALGRHRDG